MKLTNNPDLGLLILRIGISLLLLLHGYWHLTTGAAAVKAMLVAQGLPLALAYGVYVGELLAPIAILLGWRTRLAAAIAVGNFAFALWLGHQHELLSLTQYGGWAAELPALFFIPALALVFTGPGRYALSRNKLGD